MQELVLYYRPTCPFCLKVLHYMKQNEISLSSKDISNEDIRQELITVGGKGQVPCLVVDGKAMYESDDIIDWFKKNYKQPSAGRS